MSGVYSRNTFMPLVRPPRTDGHRQRDALLQQFADLGLVPVVSTNGGIPDADIQIVKALLPQRDGMGGDGKYGEVIEAYLTERGRRRLLVASAFAKTAESDARG